MDWNMLFIYSATICAILCLIGMILLVVHHELWKRRMDRIERNADKLIRRLQNAAIETTAECMDILPGKILEAKKTIEGE